MGGGQVGRSFGREMRGKMAREAWGNCVIPVSCAVLRGGSCSTCLVHGVIAGWLCGERPVMGLVGACVCNGTKRPMRPAIPKLLHGCVSRFSISSPAPACIKEESAM